ncbi:MAG TPA: hypothetical protein VMZ25_01340 [Terriglobales bacterium]|nr:hypothetical protein [Terriglobales bacterium]
MRSILALVTAVILTGGIAHSTDTMSIAQARRDFKQLLPKMYRGEFNDSWRRVEKVALQPLRSVTITTVSFAFEDAREVNGFIPAKQMKTQQQHYRFKQMGPVMVSDDHPRLPKTAFFAGPEGSGDLCTRKCGTFYWTDRADAERFARALNRLIEHAKKGKDDDDFSAFRQKAAAWRQLKQKAPLAPEADRHRILAEEAIRSTNLDSAAQHYDEALEATPLWPEGWLNAALIYAELQDYASAAEHMRYYLELAPDAPEAKAAREKLVIWEEKTK